MAMRKKTPLTRSLLAACSIVALSVALSGCLHSSDDEPATEAPADDTMMPEEPVDMDGDGVADADDAFPNNPDETMDSDMDGVGDNADAFPNDATETHDSDGDGVGDNADAFPNDATETHDSDGDGVGDNAQAAAEARASATKQAASVAMALATEAMQVVTGGEAGTDGEGGADAGLGGSARHDDDDTADEVYSDDVYGFEISRDRTGTTVEITVLGGPDERDDQTFMSVPAGFQDGITYHYRADADGMPTGEAAMVMTDIEAPTPTPFTTVYPLTTYDLNENVDGPDPDVVVANDWTAITLAAVAVDAQDKSGLANIMSSAFAAAPDPDGVLLTFVDDDTNTADVDEAAEVRGSYDGAMGTYRCDGTADCSVNLDPMGAITAISVGWIFIPDAGVTVDVPDAEYLSYGFWANAEGLEDGSLNFTEIETFAMAHGMDESDDGNTAAGGIGSVTGTATYMGGSLGMYVHNVLDEDGDIVSATSGHFEADVELNASFGGNAVAPNNRFTISGMIDNFRLYHGEENDWAVALNLADFSGRGDETPPRLPGMGAPGTAHVNTFSGTTTGDMAADAGSWNGTFWGAAGSAIDHDEDNTTDAINQAPSAVTGEFGASFTDGMVAGGFGATIDDDM